MAIHHKKTSILIPAAILFVIVCATYVGAYWYISKIKSNAQAMLVSIAEDDAKAFRTQNLASVLKEIEPLYAELRAYGVHSDEIVKFIDTVEGLGKKTGATVEIGSIAVPEGDVSAPLTATINISGSWKAMISALQLFENLPYRISMDKVRVYKTSNIAGSSSSSAKSAAASSIWGAQFEIKVLRVQ